MAITLNGSTGVTAPTWTTAGRPASPATGQTGFNTTLGTMEVYSGAAWEPLVTTNDSGTISSAMIADSAITPAKLSQPLSLIGAQNASGATVDFTGIPSWARRVTILFQGISTTSTGTIGFRVGSGSFLTSGYLCEILVQNTAGSAVAASQNGFNFTAGGALDIAGAARDGVLTLYNISGFLWVANGIMQGNNGAGVHGLVSLAGSISVGGALDRVRLFNSGADTFDAGSVNVMYEG